MGAAANPTPLPGSRRDGPAVEAAAAAAAAAAEEEPQPPSCRPCRWCGGCPGRPSGRPSSTGRSAPCCPWEMTPVASTREGWSWRLRWRRGRSRRAVGAAGAPRRRCRYRCCLAFRSGGGPSFIYVALLVISSVGNLDQAKWSVSTKASNAAVVGRACQSLVCAKSLPSGASRRDLCALVR